MNTKPKIKSISQELANKYGAVGTAQRLQNEEKAYEFYTTQLLQQARKEAKITQKQLAQQIGTDTAYISRVENGSIPPSASTFFRIIEALGLCFEIVKPF